MIGVTKISYTFHSQPNNGDVIAFDITIDDITQPIGGVTQTISLTFKTSPVALEDVQIGADVPQTILNTRDKLLLFLGTMPNIDFTCLIVGNVLEIIINDSSAVVSEIVDAPPRVTITSESEDITNKIWVRSPFFVNISEAGQQGSKVELFLWRKGETEPTTPSYPLSKSIVSPTQIDNEYNISNYGYEFMNPLKPTAVTSISEEENNTWCYMRVKRYKLSGGTYSILTSETFICFNGFKSYLDGYNKTSFDNVILLSDSTVRRYQQSDNSTYVNVWLAAGDYTWNGNSYTAATEGVYKLPLISGLNSFYDEVELKFTMTVENVCEPIYTPIIVSYVNRYGGWDFITLFKSPINTFEANSKDYNLMPSNVNYSIYEGQSATFNHQLKQRVKANTGWVDQNFSNLLTDLMVSEKILIDNKPAKILTKNFEEKTHIRDNNINYELDFEFAYNLINDVI